MIDIPLRFDMTFPVFLAYLDPGTGSMALQFLLAAVFGGLFALKQYWSGLKAWLSSRRGEE